MGAGESRVATSNLGLHVLRVAEGSPAANAGIEPFFDHIVGYNGIPMTEDTDVFQQEVERTEHRSQAMTLQIYSSKREELRDVRIQPSRDWSIPTKAVLTHQDAQPSLLGLSLRLCSPEGALEQVWHILDILDGSPAQSAGLVAFGDYVIGYSGGVLRGEGDFYDLIEQHANRPLRLFVYNSDFDITREVVIVPNRDWGNGEGLLGCGVGYGLLHRIPKPQDRPAAPAELLDRPQTPPNRNQYESHAHEDDDDEEDQGVQVVETSQSTSRPAFQPRQQPQQQQYPPIPSYGSHNKPGPLNLGGRNSPQPGNSSRVLSGPPPASPRGSIRTRSSVADVVLEEEEE